VDGVFLDIEYESFGILTGLFFLNHASDRMWTTSFEHRRFYVSSFVSVRL
jgi:hypothetical protein